VNGLTKVSLIKLNDIATTVNIFKTSFKAEAVKHKSWTGVSLLKIRTINQYYGSQVDKE